MIFNMTGGGNPLNFKVVGGTTQPTDPKENMIWVNTSTAITDWVFSATQPAEKEGRVWISTGTSSAAEFNALKKNGIQVYPTSAKQYISGAWVGKTAKSYKGGKWVEWVAYIHSVENGYNMSRFGLYSTPFLGVRSFTVDESGIYMVNGMDSLSNFIINNPIDLTPYSYLEFEVKGYTSFDGFGVGFTSSASASTDAEMKPTGWGQFSWSKKNVTYTNWEKFRIDLTAANTKMYFRIGQWNSPGGFYVRNIVFK